MIRCHRGCVDLDMPEVAIRTRANPADELMLERELGGRAPDGLVALGERERAAFAEALRRAKARQSRELDTAIEQALGIVPRLLRGTVRKLLFAG
jgi:hypothetical protein